MEAVETSLQIVQCIEGPENKIEKQGKIMTLHFHSLVAFNVLGYGSDFLYPIFPLWLSLCSM